MTNLTKRPTRPLGGPAYGSIPHLPGSRTGPSDRTIELGQARICLERTRDRHDLVIVLEKLDGSCVAVANLDGQIVPLMRALQASGVPNRCAPVAHSSSECALLVT